MASGRRPVSWLAVRFWPLVVSAAFIGTGLLFTFLWGPVAHHQRTWTDVGDLWGLYRAAQWVGWGSEGTIYAHGTGYIVYPGMAVLVAPIAMISQHFSLADPYPFYIARPSALPLLITYVLALSVVLLFAADRVMRSIGITGGRRVAVLWILGAFLWPTVAYWGHPEEAICVAFVLWAIVALREERWTTAGWLMGFAVAFQPYALLVLPMVVGLAPRGRRIGTLARSVALSAALLLLPFLQDFHDTVRTVFEQPVPFPPNHATPLLALAPRIGHDLYFPGIGRYLVGACALAAGYWAWTRGLSTLHILWVSGLLFTLRVATEPVMAPYWVWAATVFIVLAAAARGTKRLLAAFLVLGVLCLLAYRHTTEWLYWLPLVVLLMAALALSYPRRAEGPPEAIADSSELGTWDLRRRGGREPTPSTATTDDVRT